MKKLKKLVTIPNVLTLIWVGGIIFLLIKVDVVSAIILTIFSGVLCGEIISAYYLKEAERKSFKNPYTISENGAGKMFRVVNIVDKKIGLKEWGYDDKGHLGDKQSIDYYFAEGIPKYLCTVNQIFQVRQTNKGLTFYQVKFNGHLDIYKRPFEVIERAYKA